LILNILTIKFRKINRTVVISDLEADAKADVYLNHGEKLKTQRTRKEAKSKAKRKATLIDRKLLYIRVNGNG